jgi:hypothetical protein
MSATTALPKVAIRASRAGTPVIGSMTAPTVLYANPAKFGILIMKRPFIRSASPQQTPAITENQSWHWNKLLTSTMV